METTLKQLDELRQLVKQNGFLPLSPKATRLLDAADRLAAATPGLGANAFEPYRKQLADSGYLPFSRAMALLEEVAKCAGSKV